MDSNTSFASNSSFTNSDFNGTTIVYQSTTSSADLVESIFILLAFGAGLPIAVSVFVFCILPCLSHLNVAIDRCAESRSCKLLQVKCDFFLYCILRCLSPLKVAIDRCAESRSCKPLQVKFFLFCILRCLSPLKVAIDRCAESRSCKLLQVKCCKRYQRNIKGRTITEYPVVLTQIIHLSEGTITPDPTEPAAHFTYLKDPCAYPLTEDKRLPMLDIPRLWTRETRSKCQERVLFKDEIYTTEADEVVRDEVKRLVHETWEQQHVALGRDARNINHTKIEVLEVQLVVNRHRLLEYQMKRFQLRAFGNQIKAFPGPQPVKTSTVDVSRIGKDISTEINEYYLFHGTKKNVVDIIKAQGFDQRLCDRALFGTGVYFAESSTKADQYADTGDTGYMFVARVLLGNVYVCDRARGFCRPPCMTKNCTKLDKCTEHGELFDSVMGVGAPDGRKLLFREFIVYDKMMCYPEYIVKYKKL